MSQRKELDKCQKSWRPRGPQSHMGKHERGSDWIEEWEADPGGLLGGGGIWTRARRLKRNFQAAKAKKHISGSRTAWWRQRDVKTHDLGGPIFFRDSPRGEKKKRWLMRWLLASVVFPYFMFSFPCVSLPAEGRLSVFTENKSQVFYLLLRLWKALSVGQG